jgi:branched-chain amino acid transport system ATP-binding protein
MPSTEGRVELGGQDITSMPPNQRVALGLVRTFQINQLFTSLTPLQSLALVVSSRIGAAGRWWKPLGSDAAVAAECEALLAQFRLSEHADQVTKELPYGKRRLLEIGLAVALKPRVLLLDEPAAGVPSAERQDILDTVAALPEEVSVLLIEHDMDLVFSFAKSMTVLVNGTVLTEGTPAEIAADAQVKAVYLGDSLAGISPGR